MKISRKKQAQLYLESTEILHFTAGILETLSELSLPACPPKYEQHADLLDALFEDKELLAKRSINRNPAGWLQWFREQHAEAMFESIEQVQWVLSKNITNCYREHIMQFWPEMLFTRLDQAIESLRDRERNIICKRFGLQGHAKMTLQEIADEEKVGRVRIGQLEQKALVRLRNPRHRLSMSYWSTAQLGAAFFAVDTLMEQNEKIRNAVDMLTDPAPEKNPILTLIFATSVNTLTLSVRVTYCFMRTKIKTLADLVQKRESELLKLRNFGRKSLREVKDELALLNLSLGMTLDPLLVAAIEQHVQSLTPSAP